MDNNAKVNLLELLPNEILLMIAKYILVYPYDINIMLEENNNINVYNILTKKLSNEIGCIHFLVAIYNTNSYCNYQNKFYANLNNLCKHLMIHKYHPLLCESIYDLRDIISEKILSDHYLVGYYMLYLTENANNYLRLNIEHTKEYKNSLELQIKCQIYEYFNVCCYPILPRLIDNSHLLSASHFHQLAEDIYSRRVYAATTTFKEIVYLTLSYHKIIFLTFYKLISDLNVSAHTINNFMQKYPICYDPWQYLFARRSAIIRDFLPFKNKTAEFNELYKFHDYYIFNKLLWLVPIDRVIDFIHLKYLQFSLSYLILTRKYNLITIFVDYILKLIDTNNELVTNLNDKDSSIANIINDEKYLIYHLFICYYHIQYNSYIKLLLHDKIYKIKRYYKLVMNKFCKEFKVKKNRINGYMDHIIYPKQFNIKIHKFFPFIPKKEKNNLCPYMFAELDSNNFKFLYGIYRIKQFIKLDCSTKCRDEEDKRNFMAFAEYFSQLEYLPSTKVAYPKKMLQYWCDNDWFYNPNKIIVLHKDGYIFGYNTIKYIIKKDHITLFKYFVKNGLNYNENLIIGEKLLKLICKIKEKSENNETEIHEYISKRVKRSEYIFGKCCISFSKKTIDIKNNMKNDK